MNLNQLLNDTLYVCNFCFTFRHTKLFKQIEYNSFLVIYILIYIVFLVVNVESVGEIVSWIL